MKTSIAGHLLEKLNGWYDQQSSTDQLYLADARGELEENLHILDSAGSSRNIDHMLALSNFMHRSLFKPDEAAKRSHQAACYLADEYIASFSPVEVRTTPKAPGNADGIISDWQRLLKHYDGSNYPGFVGSTAVYFIKLSAKWGTERDTEIVKGYAAELAKSIGSDKAAKNSAPAHGLAQ